MPRCLSEGVDIFLKSVERQGESGHDVRVIRSAPWMARVGGPVILRTAISLFIRKFTPGDATLRRDVPFAMGVRGFLTNSQVISFYNHPSIRLLELSTVLPWMASPSSTIAPFAVLRISSSVWDRPLPSWVQKG